MIAFGIASVSVERMEEEEGGSGYSVFLFLCCNRFFSSVYCQFCCENVICIAIACVVCLLRDQTSCADLFPRCHPLAVAYIHLGTVCGVP